MSEQKSQITLITELASQWSTDTGLSYEVISTDVDKQFLRATVAFSTKTSSHPVPSYLCNIHFTLYPDRVSGLDILFKVENNETIYDASQPFSPQLIHEVLNRKQRLASRLNLA
ncbi:hypothetical protein GEMRC1_004100 [Eukaryota sp. GEM-RC1]